jgi:tetratricopeptide (TPR) repeat protein
MSTTHQFESLLAAAAEAQRAGRMDLAEQHCRQALELSPDCIPAQYVLGILLAREGDTLEAISLLTKVVAAEPNTYEALISLSSVYLDTGDIQEALPLALRATEIRPSDPQAFNHLGRCYLNARQLESADAALRNAIALNPGYAPAYHNLGRVLLLQGKDGAAAQALGRAVEISATYTHMLAYAGALFTLRQYEPAEACAKSCISLNPNSGPAHLLLCGILAEQQRTDEAKTHLLKAIELGVEPQEAHLLAARQQQLGLIEGAADSLRLAIEKTPDIVWAYKSFAYNQRITEKDRPIVDRMKSMVERPLSPTEAAAMRYALAKSLEDLGEYEESMRHYDEANRLRRQITIGDMPFDGSMATESVDRLIEAFTQRSGVATSNDSELPIVVVGMMRSGTTLAEQILSSHPAVGPAGEQLFWIRNAHRIFTEGPDVLGALGTEYVETLASISPNSVKVTDKMPGNYHFAGFIHLALPNARIIHMRRSPVDTGLSIWATPNDIPSEGGHLKAGVVHVYKEYLRLMAFWRSVLPADRFLEVDYEEIVTEPEKMARRMVAFCGLEWDDACLHPEHNARVVNTPSLWQVRQPFYKTSVERWRKFEPWLGDLHELVGVDHPATSNSATVANHEGRR